MPSVRSGMERNPKARLPPRSIPRERPKPNDRSDREPNPGATRERGPHRTVVRRHNCQWPYSSRSSKHRSFRAKCNWPIRRDLHVGRGSNAQLVKIVVAGQLGDFVIKLVGAA